MSFHYLDIAGDFFCVEVSPGGWVILNLAKLCQLLKAQ